MSAPIELNETIDESTRLAYLAAMQVEQWIPAAAAANIRQKSTHAIGTTKPQDSDTNWAKNSEPSRSEASAPLESNQNSVSDSQEPIDSIQLTEKIDELASGEDIHGKNTSHEGHTDKELQSNHFLKLVSWTNPILSEGKAKTLMIVCRHQVDQPANSFARSNSPSQFMMDYINAINHFCTSDNFEVKIKLAHLSAAGLSEDSLPLTNAVTQHKPKAMLLLGDETVTHLLGEKMDVANTRGQVHKLGDGTRVLVSYHPFSLIQNPSLKRLAFEDLALLSEFLANNS